MPKSTTRTAVTPSTAKRLLAALGSKCRDWLGDPARALSWFDPPLRTVEAAASEGWYVSLAQLSRGGGTLTLFYDRSAGATTRHLWYGFSATTEQRIAEIAAAGRPRYGPAIEDSEARRLDASEFERPFLEHIGSREYYYGIYLRDPAAILAEQHEELAARIGGFFIDVAAELDRLSGVADGGDEALSPTERETRNAAARPEQGKFRSNVLSAFRSTCCITGCQLIPLLEACHIRTLDGEDDNSRENGLLLRVDLHRLFDLGLVAVEPRRLTVWLHPSLEGSEYARFRGAPLEAPPSTLSRLSRRALEERWKRRQSSPHTAD